MSTHPVSAIERLGWVLLAECVEVTDGGGGHHAPPEAGAATPAPGHGGVAAPWGDARKG